MISKRYGSKRAGFTAIELLVSIPVCLVIGAGLVQFIYSMYDSQTSALSQNTANLNARKAMDTIADALRNAQNNSSDNKSVFVSSATISANDVSFYTSATGDTVRFWLQPISGTSVYQLEQTTTPKNGTPKTITLLSDVASLSLTYTLDTGTLYTSASSSWTSPVNSHAPTTAEQPNVGLVQIQVNINHSGCVRQLSSFVRLRNSPLKASS